MGVVQRIPLAILEREGILRHLHHQETLNFQHHVDESSIEGRTRQASRQEEIQSQSQGKNEEKQGGRRKARKTAWQPCAASQKWVTEDGPSIPR